MYLLDTNTCIQLLTGRSPSVTTRFLACSPTQINLCSIVIAELTYGAYHNQKVEQNLLLLEKFCEPLESLAFNDKCAKYYGILREELTKKGQLIGANDMLIAASRISALQFEDWEV